MPFAFAITIAASFTKRDVKEYFHLNMTHSESINDGMNETTKKQVQAIDFFDFDYAPGFSKKLDREATKGKKGCTLNYC